MNKEVVEFAFSVYKNFEKEGRTSKKWIRISNIIKEKFGIEISSKQIRDKINYLLKKEEGFYIFLKKLTIKKRCC